MAAGLLSACSDEVDPGETPSCKVHLRMGAQGFHDVSGDEGLPGAETRALPDGFVTYDNLYTPTLPTYAQIQGFFVSDTTNPVQPVFNFEDDDDNVSPTRSWSANVPIKAGESCYFFGFMPKEETGSGSIAPLNSSYDNGVVMTINNIRAVTSSDVCVVVGVQRNDNNTDLITNLDMASRLGKFDFVPQQGDDNYLYLLADHLYCSLHFKMKIDAAYNELRTIKIKQVRLRIADDSGSVKSVNATVTLAANNTLQNPLSAAAGGSVSFTVGERGEATPAILYNCADDTDHPEGIQLLTSEMVGFRGCFVPGFNFNFILETVYDVYDRKGNLIRENDTARNTLQPAATLQHGQEYTYNITVNPTYLYMLSEPDLDSPTFTIQ